MTDARRGVTQSPRGLTVTIHGVDEHAVDDQAVALDRSLQAIPRRRTLRDISLNWSDPSVRLERYDTFAVVSVDLAAGDSDVRWSKSLADLSDGNLLNLAARRLHDEARRRNHAALKAQTLTRVCDNCSTEFDARSSRARFCSGRCRVAAHRTRQNDEKSSISTASPTLRPTSC